MGWRRASSSRLSLAWVYAAKMSRSAGIVGLESLPDWLADDPQSRFFAGEGHGDSAEEIICVWRARRLVGVEYWLTDREVADLTND